MTEAAHLSARFAPQYFDTPIIAAAARAGTMILLSKDMNDGLKVGGLRVVSPFVAANAALITAHFAKS